MKYRIEVQQVFGTTGVAFDTDAQWLELDVKPRGLAAAKVALKAAVDVWKTGAPHRLVAILDGTSVVVEVLSYQSPYAKLVADAKPPATTVEFCGETIKAEYAGKAFTFRVSFEEDTDSGEPWKECDGHGPVSDWVSRDKFPGEFVLNGGRHGSKRFYDYAEACRIARRDGWDAKPYNDGSQTKRQQAAKAALSDFNYLRGWCVGDWQYVGVVVTLLDDNGEETSVSGSLWGVEDQNDYHHTAALELAGELLAGYGSSWGLVSKETFDYLQTEAN